MTKVQYGKSTVPFLTGLAKKFVDMSSDLKEQQWFPQHLSLAVVKENTASILACAQAWSDFDCPKCTDWYGIGPTTIT